MSWSAVARYSTRLRLVLAAMLLFSLSPLLSGVASAAVTVTDTKANNCNGVRETPGSENTLKDIVGGSLERGGDVTFQISFPYDPDEVGGEFKIDDCFEVAGTGQVIKSIEITFVPNNNNFTFDYTLTIPDSIPVGTEVCNYAKTTKTPSNAQGSNRKGAICFTVGGTLRIEKQDAATGELATGGRFTVACTPVTEYPSVVIAGLETTADGGTEATGNPATGYANSGVISINGPEGTPCSITEVTPPPGYLMPTPNVFNYTIPATGSDNATKVIENQPVVTTTYDDLTVATTPTGTYDVATSWTLGKTVDDDAVEGVAGGTAGPVDWTVTATKTVGAATGFAVSDSADISNSNAIPVLATVTATLGGAALTVDCDPGTAGTQSTVTVPAATGDDDGVATCAYSGTGSATTDQVVVTATPTTPGVGGGSSGQQPVTWTVNNTGPQSLAVDDSRPGSPLPQTVQNSDSWTYSESFPCPGDATLYDDGVYTTEITNTATATDLPDATATVDVTCSPTAPVQGLDLDKEVVASDPSVNPGDTLTYTLTATATGDAPETDVVVTDYVPGFDPAKPGSGKTTYVPGSAACDAGTCEVDVDTATGLITWSIGDLQPAQGEVAAQVRRLTFAVTVDAPPASGTAVDDVVNVGAIDSAESAEEPSNEVVTPVTVVLSQPPTSTVTQTPTTVPSADQDRPRVLPFTGAWVLPTMALGLAFALIGALLIGAGRSRTQE